jgi:hypothetical protein
MKPPLTPTVYNGIYEVHLYNELCRLLYKIFIVNEYLTIAYVPNYSMKYSTPDKYDAEHLVESDDIMVYHV